jgi:hypothetical protein
VLDGNLMSIEQDHADPGTATDLANIAIENNNWYAIINAWNSKAMALAIAGWAESNGKLFLCDSQDSTIVDTVVSGATDLCASVQSQDYGHTTVWYHPSCGDFLAASVGGRLLPTIPGSETWKFKSLRGVDPVVLTSTQRTNLLNKSGNSYYEVANGRNITFEGTVGDGEFIDNIRGIDWLQNEIQSAVFDALSAPDDDGISVVEAAVLAALKRGVKNKLLAADPAPTVEAPSYDDIDEADIAARTLPDVNFTANLAGAIHSTSIFGTVSS